MDQDERNRVIACGMTEAEAACWDAVAVAAIRFLALPELHSMDAQEACSAFHIVQNKLLARPIYRKYLADSPRSPAATDDPNAP